MTEKRFASCGRSLIGTLAVAGLLPGVAGAQAVLEEVVVTARKRTESLQNVPIQVGVFDAEAMRRQGLNDLADITQQSTSLVFDRGFSPQDTRIVIRGLSPTRGRQNVAVLQDGIDVSSEATRTAGGTLLVNERLIDVERVEVVKGPQSALYGRSAFAGAINYITRKPGDELDGSIGLDIGDNGQLELRGGVSGPVIEDRLALGINASYWEHDGFYTNPITGGDLGDQEGYGVAATAMFQATDNLVFNARVEFSDDEFGVPAQATVQPTVDLPIPPQAIGTVVPASLESVLGVTGTIEDADELDITISENPKTGEDYPGTDREITRFTLTADWATDWGDFTSLTHFAETETFQFHDGQREGSLEDLIVGAEVWFDTQTDLFSQEFRLASNTDGPVQWTVGGLYWNEDYDMQDGSVACIVARCAQIYRDIDTIYERYPDTWTRETDHWSVFGLVDWQFAEDWQLILEGRYSWEDLDVTGPDDQFFVLVFSDPVPFPTNSLEASTDDSWLAPKATVQWTPNDESMLYASIAYNEKPGGFTTLTGGLGFFNPDRAEFEPEELTVYEIGAKSQWLDNTLQLNGAVFYQDFSEKQTSTQVPDETLLVLKPLNNASAEIWGLELEAQWAATDNLSLGLNYTWLDAEYDDYRVNNTAPNVIAEAGNCLVLTLDGLPTCELNYSGNVLEDVPDHSLVANLIYRQPINTDLDWFTQINARYQSERNEGDTNLVELDAYSVVDALLGFTYKNAEFLVYVDNVFDDDTPRSALATSSSTNLRIVEGQEVVPNLVIVNLPDPRAWGVRARLNF